jgi:hypothetical protein
MGQLLGWLMLLAACFVVRRVWLDSDARTETAHWWRSWPAWLPRNPARRARLRRLDLARNPMFWLAVHQSGTASAMYLFAVAAAVGAAGFLVAPDAFMPYYLGGCCVANFVIKGWVAAQACRFNAQARRTSMLEMTLVSPLTSEQITSGQIQALVRVFLPAIAVTLGVELLGLFLGLTLGTSAGSADTTLIFASIVYLALFACDTAAVMWTGMWFGLTAKKESQAITKTIAYVLVAPYLTLPICGCLGIPLFLFSSIAWLNWARHRLQTDFREYATGRQPHAYARPDGTLLPVPSFTRRPPPLPPIQG